MKTEEAAKIWRQVTSHPTAVSGFLRDAGDGDSLSLETTWKQINITSGKHVTFTRQHYLANNDADAISTGNNEINQLVFHGMYMQCLN